VYFDGGSKASLHCTLRDRRKKFENRFGLSKHLKHCGPRRQCKQAASVENVSLRELAGVMRGPFGAGPDYKKIDQIGLKPAKAAALLCKH